jgi:hypothetical protein
MKPALSAALFIAVATIVSLDAGAQGFPRRDRSGSPRDAQATRDREQKASVTAAAASDPFAALERELPSLKVDLMLTAEQVAAWSVFERDVRDVAEMDRTRRRHLISLRTAGESPPTAVAMIAALAEDDRLKAEASGDMKRHLEALYAKLDDTQKRTLDRRVVLSQVEPLGR